MRCAYAKGTLVLLGWLGIAALAAAQPQSTTTHGPFSVTSTGGGQLSNVIHPLNVQTGGVLRVEYTAAATHCSDVRMHFLVDGVERAVSAFLVPGASSGFFDVGPVAAGAHTVGLQAEGRVGGCNIGALSGWGGTAQTVTSQLAEAAVPAPGLLLTFLVFAAGAVLAGPWRRRLRR